MAQFYDSLNGKLVTFIKGQHIFFVASAAADGRINLSPKGMDTFRVLDEQRVAFMNLTGSGNETAAHLHIDGRLTIMFCSFEEKPLILRLYGHGRAIHRRDAAWAEYAPLFPEAINNRNIILMQVNSVQTSCGFAVPFYDFAGERRTRSGFGPLLMEWAENRGEAGVQKYWAEKNQISIDGLPTKLLAD